ncbi:hypothetical protein [Mycolicibacterium llatzerense]|uniref:hypothetical protein n=1 Tax=Mycolicibacterium llatzerense TaxID=280871 RepID=UPI0021B62BED|nr:hypothetical protein [Mycolicibacterium llatzerense]MCT7366514.1 hypothetical protein [Mycolicibacterium llatzerense]
MGMQITRKTVGGTGWPLRDQADMLAALAELSAQGWTGAISFEAGAWQLRLSGDGRNTVNATLGQWLVEDGDLKALPCSTFDDGYESDTPVEFPQVVEQPVEAVVEESVPFGSLKSPDVSSRMVVS